jgi:hypothetical protein
VYDWSTTQAVSALCCDGNDGVLAEVWPKPESRSCPGSTPSAVGVELMVEG